MQREIKNKGGMAATKWLSFGGSDGNSKIYKSDMTMPKIQTRPEVTEHSKATFNKPIASIAFPGDKLKAFIPKLGM